MPEWDTAGIVVFVNLAVDALLVAWIAGWRAMKKIEKWFLGERSDPVIEKIADRVRTRVMADVPTRKDIEELRADLGGFEARIRAEMPPNVDGRIAEVHALVDSLGQYVQQQMAAFGAEFEALPAKIGETVKMHELAARSVEARALASTMDDITGEVTEEARRQVQADPRLRAYERLMSRKLPEGYAEKNPMGAMLFDEVREWVAERRLRGGGYDGYTGGGSGNSEM